MVLFRYILLIYVLLVVSSCSKDEDSATSRLISIRGQVSIINSKVQEEQAIVQFKHENEILAYAFTGEFGFYEVDFNLDKNIDQLWVDVVPTASMFIHEMENTAGEKLISQLMPIRKSDMVLNIKMLAQAHLWIELKEVGTALDYDRGIVLPASNYSGEILTFKPNGSINTDKHLFPVPGGIEEEVHVNFLKNDSIIRQEIYPVLVAPFDTSKIVVNF